MAGAVFCPPMHPKPFCSFAVSSIPDKTAFIADVEVAGIERARTLLANRRNRRHAAGSPGADAVEYLQLAVKRWRYYLAEGHSPRSLEDAKRRIKADPDCELGFLLAAQVRQTPDIEAGFCFLRRVWTGRFVVDFLSVHPSVFDLTTGGPQLTGTGAGLLAAAAKLAVELGGDGIWGEATKNSHGFYQHMTFRLGLDAASPPVTDFFRFDRPELQLMADRSLSRESS